MQEDARRTRQNRKASLAVARDGSLALLLVSALAWIAVGCASTGARERDNANRGSDERPNIVIFFTDDQGYADVSCFGATGLATPHIDQLADEGMKLTSFYVAQAVCSASRASLLTGCYANRVSLLGALFPWTQHGLHPDEITIADMLRDEGYATGIFGKWHLGHHEKFLPLAQGFDEYYGVPYSNDMWPVHYDGRSAVDDGSWKAKYPYPPVLDGNRKVEELRTFEDQDRLTRKSTDRALAFVRKNRNRPFFLYVPFSMPHVPLGVSPEFRLRTPTPYGDVITEIDHSVGRVLDCLDELDLADNTLVVFTSDNGPWLNFGNHGGSAAPLREGKGTMWEGGARVPCVIRYPGRIGPGSESAAIASTIDLLPTIAELTGTALPVNKIDGVSLVPLLSGNEDRHLRDHFFFYYGRQLRAVRSGKWKLHFPHPYRKYEGQKPGMDGVAGRTATGRTGLELYDLDADIGERLDLAIEHPDVVHRLMALGRTARAALGDQGLDGSEVRPVGKLDD